MSLPPAEVNHTIAGRYFQHRSPPLSEPRAMPAAHWRRFAPGFLELDTIRLRR
jgi:hypothetical protein